MSVESSTSLTSNSQEENSIDFLKIFGKVLNTINHGLIAIVTFYTCWLAFSVEEITVMELHIAFSTLGYQFLMAETIMALAEENSWTFSLQKSTKKIIHWVMAFMGIALSIAGTSLIIKNKSMHFTSNHGILGLAAMVLIVPTFMNGPLTFFSRRFNKKIKPVYLRLYHIITSSGAFVLGVSCLILGFEKRWFSSKTSTEFVTCFTVFSSITVVITMINPIINCYRIIKGMFMKY